MRGRCARRWRRAPACRPDWPEPGYGRCAERRRSNTDWRTGGCGRAQRGVPLRAEIAALEMPCSAFSKNADIGIGVSIGGSRQLDVEFIVRLLPRPDKPRISLFEHADKIGIARVDLHGDASNGDCSCPVLRSR